MIYYCMYMITVDLRFFFEFVNKVFYYYFYYCYYYYYYYYYNESKVGHVVAISAAATKH